MTGDIDLYYQIIQGNVKRPFDALREFRNDEIPGIQNEKELMQEGVIFQFGAPPNRIDLISIVEGVQFAIAWMNRKVETLLYKNRSFPAYYTIGLDDLMRNSIAHMVWQVTRMMGKWNGGMMSARQAVLGWARFGG